MVDSSPAVRGTPPPPGRFLFMEPTPEQIADIQDIAGIVARNYSRRMGVFGAIEADDLHATALLGAYRGHLSFQPSKGAQYRTWLSVNAAGAVRHYIRDQVSLVHIPRPLKERLAKAGQLPPPPISLDKAFDTRGYSGDDESVSLHDAIPAPTDLALLALEVGDGIRRNVSVRDRHMLGLYYIEGKTQTEVGQAVGVSQKAVSRTLRRLVPRLRAVLAEGA